MKIYGDSQSGNCYKIKLLMSFLEIEHDWVDVDILNNETKAASFLSRNPSGKIPLLELDDGRYLSESNAILNYLATGTTFLSEDPFEYAKIQQWQFFEQYSHEPYIAVARFIAKYLGLPDDKKDEYESKQTGGHAALTVMEQQLAITPFLVASRVTTADISLYGYTHVASEGGFDLSLYPAVERWLLRVRSEKNYIGMS